MKPKPAYILAVSVALIGVLTTPWPDAGASLVIHTGSSEITKLDDLPRHNYELDGSVAELLDSEEQWRRFAAALRADIERDLESYQIEDPTTLKRLYGTLAGIHIIENRFDDALAVMDKVRDLEEKPARRLTSGLTSRSIITATRETPGESEAAYRESFRRDLAKALRELPWDTVQEEIEAQKGQLEMFSESFFMGLVDAQLENVVATTGQVSFDVAYQLVSIKRAMETILPVKKEIISVYQEAIDANKVTKADIWAERSVTLSEDEPLNRVLVAIWDTGVDMEVFKPRVFVNPRERANGEDSDGNGFVDDLHGIAYTLHSDKTPEILYPLGENAARVSELRDQIKGYFDLKSAIDSPEAQAVRAKLAQLEPGELKRFFEDLGEFGLYTHGTHVAGIAVEGNPFADVLTARLTADLRMIPEPQSVEDARKAAKAIKETVAYFKAHGVRAVNMSWGVSLKDEERILELNGIGKDAEERAMLAREIFDIYHEGLHDALSGAPEMLFITSAGNEDNDVSFDEMIPSAFELPNLLTVGAVDQAGDPTGFTSFGDAVHVYANGFEVESFVPGGERMSFSGTSMSSPNAANLAAKLLAIDPTLSPQEVIALIIKGADRTDGEPSLLLINPKRSVELLKAGAKKRKA